MKTPKLQDISNEQLADRFKQLSLQQGEAEMGSDMRTYKRRYQQLKDIGEELGRRGPEARRALAPLLDCPRDAGALEAVAQCRYNAARELLAVEPARARNARGDCEQRHSIPNGPGAPYHRRARRRYVQADLRVKPSFL